MSRKDSDTFSSQDIPQPHCLITGTRGNVVTIWMKLDNLHTHIYKDSQKIKIKKKTKTPRITDEGWNSQKRLSDPVEKKMKEGIRRKKRLLYLHPKLSSGLVPL